MTDLKSDVTVVCVTYGKRWFLLRQVLRAAKDQGARRAVVVDNGATENIHELAAAEFGDWVIVRRLAANTGSANGFHEGIAGALQTGISHIMLLDDDNVPEPGCLAALEQAHDRTRAEQGELPMAMLAYRRDHQAGISNGVSERRLWAAPDSFLDFHLKDIFFKIWRRLPWARSKNLPTHELPALVRMPYAPYGGLYFHRSVPESIGLPFSDMILYADDTEYTYRLTKAGGTIWLVTAACVQDIDQSWNTRKNLTNSFERWLKGESTFRVFYCARNQTWFESKNRTNHGWIRAMNRRIYLGLLWAYALKLHEMDRFRVLCSAIRDGEAGTLGINGQFPLP